MPRYLVERTCPEQLSHPAGAEESKAGDGSIKSNELEGVTWVHSYVNEERTKVFCVYDGPSPEAIRNAAARDLPLDAITEIPALDRNFHSPKVTGGAADMKGNPSTSADA